MIRIIIILLHNYTHYYIQFIHMLLILKTFKYINYIYCSYFTLKYKILFYNDSIKNLHDNFT